MSGVTSSCNAVIWLLDRNVDQGRANKLTQRFRLRDGANK